MVVLRPFRGVRFNPEKVEIEKVVTPPYDVIDEEERERYYALHRYNIIRIDYGREAPPRRYAIAAELYRRWREEGILLQDESPSLYYYRQDYTLRGERRALRGIIGAVRLSDYSEGQVLPHEETLSSPKQDRLELLRHTRASFSQIYGLYEDREGSITRLVESSLGELLADFEDSSGIRHRFWRLEDGERIEEVCAAFEDRKVFIADGHHRYETALAFRDEMRRLGGGGDAPYEYVPMFLANMYDRGVSILPAHRVIRHGFSTAGFLRSAGEYFEVREFAGTPEEFFDALYSDHRRFGFFREGFYLLTLKDPAVMDTLLPGRSPVLRRLNVTVLHSLILHRLLRFREREDNIAYVVGEERAVEMVRGGGFTAAFFLNPTRVEEIRDVALAGERMPGKATYFYPKLLTGLVIYDLGEGHARG
ncbi:MAG: DUF1015 domain-containing protein [Euryarchaeota archaeon]|nr:DUF1015 domain-containing protein [Euryarchaeota archaeon]